MVISRKGKQGIMGRNEAENYSEQIAMAGATAMLDCLPMGICVVGQDGAIRFWNRRMESWTGLHKHQITGQPLERFFPHFKLPRYQKRLHQVLHQGLSATFNSRLYPHLFPCHTSSGIEIVQYTSVTPVPADDGLGFEAMFSVQDVTDTFLAEQSLQRLHQQERLLEQTMHQIRQSLDLRQILQTTVTEVRKFLQADRVLICRFHGSSQRTSISIEDCAADYTRMVEWQVRPPIFSSTGKPLPVMTKIQSFADITRSPLEPAYIELLQSFEVKALLSIPLWQGDRVWGLLIAHQCKQERPWQVGEIDLLERLANRLSVAIQQGELYQQVQELNADLEQKIAERTLQLQQTLELEATLKRITDKVRDSLDENQILQVAVEELGQGLNVETCSTGIYHDDQTRVTIDHRYSCFPSQTATLLVELSATEEIYQQLREGVPSQFCPIPNLPHTSWESCTSLLVCPILDNQGILGDIRLCRHRLKGFDELEIRLVQQVANQCAIALRQSRLYRAAQAQVEELAKLNQLKTDFLSTISHELRTPLSSIKLSVQILEITLRQLGILDNPEAESPQTQKTYQYLKIIQSECEREIDLIADILTLQQLDAGTQPYIPSTVRLQHWIPQVIETFEEQAHNRQQKIQVDIPPQIPVMTTDLLMFNRLLGELLTNACKFTPEGGVITIAVEQLPILQNSTSWVILKFSNTGIEIPESELEQIFQLFYRIPSNDPWKYGGTGMGLALVKRLVANLGGQIWAESCQNQTCFTVQLPLGQGAPYGFG